MKYNNVGNNRIHGGFIGDGVKWDMDYALKDIIEEILDMPGEYTLIDGT